MMKVIDYSARVISGKALSENNVTGVMRYLPKEGRSRVAVLSKSEYDDLRKYGIEVGFIGEQLDARRPLQGYEAGIHDANWFRRKMVEMGIPFRCIYAAYDYADSDEDAIRQSLQYARGWYEVLRERAGAYGFHPVLREIERRNLASFYWYCGRRQTPDPGYAALYQWNNGRIYVDGVECDLNYVLKDDYGQNGYEPWEGTEMALDIVDEDLLTGRQRFHRACEVGLARDGGNSLFVKRQWVAFSVGWNAPGTEYEFVIGKQGGGYYSGPEGGSPLKGIAANDDRVWWELPKGACSWSLEYNVPLHAVPALYVIREVVG